MHLLPVTTVSLDDCERAVDLRQEPAEVIALSFADSDLMALAAAHRRGGDALPSLRLASLRQLRHPLSVDLYVEGTVSGARYVLVRCLGGLDYWRYGLERLKVACAANGTRLAVLPGDDRDDPRLLAVSTEPSDVCAALGGYFRAGGPENLEALLRFVGRRLGRDLAVPPPRPLPRAFACDPEGRAVSLDVACAAAQGRPTALLIVYRSAVLAGDTRPAAALARDLDARGVSIVTLAVSSLRDEDATRLTAEAIALAQPAAIVTTTAFSARDDDAFVLDRADCPVFQAIVAGGTAEAWRSAARGLSATDLAMQVVLPECDGRIGLSPIAFKAPAEADAGLGLSGRSQEPDAVGIGAAADRVAAWIRVARTAKDERRLALVLSDYPARAGRAGFAVGLDTPASVARILDLLAAAGYDTKRDLRVDALMPALTAGEAVLSVPLARYSDWFDALPAEPRAACTAAWGMPADDPLLRDGAFRFRALRAGKVTIALQPDRGRGGERKARYHDAALPPSHAYLAFYLGLREIEPVDALIHLGTHGTTEWLPGKAAALSATCWPQIVVGALPVVYPFIVDDPGEAAPAKRRLSALTLGHLTPAIAATGLSDDLAVLRELVEEYSAAQVLDPRRAELVAGEIVEKAEANGLAALCGIERTMPMGEALTRLDAHLCDLAEVAVRDGLHVFGKARAGYEACAAGERDGLLRALDGRFVAPGPAGSPSRGRLDVLPTGRNLATTDPRAIPTRAATVLGARAAAEVLRRHLQDEGDYPRRIVMDLWASPTLRTGGEDIAHALALMGTRPTWDNATTRVTGFEILPQPLLAHPRIDVTMRISGLFRDVFSDQIALLDRAARAVAALDEDDDGNALAAARRRGEGQERVFGAAPGRYGAGVAGLALDDDSTTRGDLAAAYLAATSHAYGAGEERETSAFRTRLRDADAFVHTTDVAERDLLDGNSTGDSVGGFAAAAQSLGAAPALYSLDTSRPERPKARTLREDVARLVFGRIAHPRWLDAQLKHGYRGAAEIAQAVDALFLFAATTDAVHDAALDVAYAAIVADAARFERIGAANADAAQAILDRFAEADRRGFWRSRRNSPAVLAVRAEAER